MQIFAKCDMRHFNTFRYFMFASKMADNKNTRQCELLEFGFQTKQQIEKQ